MVKREVKDLRVRVPEQNDQGLNATCETRARGCDHPRRRTYSGISIATERRSSTGTERTSFWYKIHI